MAITRLEALNSLGHRSVHDSGEMLRGRSLVGAAVCYVGMKPSGDVQAGKRSALPLYAVGLPGRAWPFCSLEDIGPLLLPDPRPTEWHLQPSSVSRSVSSSHATFFQ